MTQMSEHELFMLSVTTHVHDADWSANPASVDRDKDCLFRRSVMAKIENECRYVA